MAQRNGTAHGRWSAHNLVAGYRDLRDAGSALERLAAGPIRVEGRRISTLGRVTGRDADLDLEHAGATGVVAAAPPGRTPRDEVAPDAIVVEAPRLGRFVGTGVLVEMLGATVVDGPSPEGSDPLRDVSSDDGWRFVARAVADGLTVVGIHLDDGSDVGGITEVLIDAGAACLARVGTDGHLFASSVSPTGDERR